ncbi:MAG: FAD-dependent oxidoreductase [Solirubrobacterales bacterium]|nr:FAD-dependent oxidoreductase [Solirubrobacterales bacterium]
MSTAAPIVIVGASLAGLRAAQALRKADPAREVVVIGQEEHLPYTRPPLSKQLLAGEQEAEHVALPGGDLDVTWRLGVRATGLDRRAHEVVLEEGPPQPYDRVILATGCRARPWTGPGAELSGVHVLRDLPHALALRDELRAGARLVVLGAGFVGCEVAATARRAGLEVTLVDLAAHPMLPLGPAIGSRMADLHEGEGVALRLGVGVEALHGDGRVNEVELADGSRLPADVVLVALGAQPNVEWLEESGLTLDGGVVCDATLTSVDDPDVLAAGDLCSWPHPLAQGDRIRVEHWTNAVEQGTLAGANAPLDPVERAAHVAVPTFWSDQYERKVQAVGLPGLADAVEVVREGDGKLVAAARRDGRLIGAVAFNDVRGLMAYRKALAAGEDVPPPGAADDAEPAPLANGAR